MKRTKDKFHCPSCFQGGESVRLQNDSTTSYGSTRDRVVKCPKCERRFKTLETILGEIKPGAPKPTVASALVKPMVSQVQRVLEQSLGLAERDQEEPMEERKRLAECLTV